MSKECGSVAGDAVLGSVVPSASGEVAAAAVNSDDCGADMGTAGTSLYYWPGEGSEAVGDVA